jgi:hypothetical protein
MLQDINKALSNLTKNINSFQSNLPTSNEKKVSIAEENLPIEQNTNSMKVNAVENSKVLDEQIPINCVNNSVQVSEPKVLSVDIATKTDFISSQSTKDDHPHAMVFCQNTKDSVVNTTKLVKHKNKSTKKRAKKRNKVKHNKTLINLNACRTTRHKPMKTNPQAK